MQRFFWNRYCDAGKIDLLHKHFQHQHLILYCILIFDIRVYTQLCDWCGNVIFSGSPTSCYEKRRNSDQEAKT